MTQEIANAGSVSSVCTVGSADCEFTSVTSGAYEVGADESACSNLGPVQMNGSGGTLYPAQSLNYNNLAHSDADNTSVGATMNFGSGADSHNVMLTGCLTLGFPEKEGGYDWDMIMMLDSVGDQYFDMQVEDDCDSSGVMAINLENRAVQHTTCIDITPQSTFYFSMNWDMTNGIGTLFIFTPQGTLIGSSYLAEATSDSYSSTRVFSNENGSNAGTYSKYQNMMMTWTVTPPHGTASVANGSPTVTWASGSTFVEGSQWGQAQWGGFLNLGGTMYSISSCPSTTTCTLTTNYTGTSGTVSYTAELPLFWSNGSSSTTPPQPATGLTATVR